jgi:hypothetical protein
MAPAKKSSFIEEALRVAQAGDKKRKEAQVGHAG